MSSLEFGEFRLDVANARLYRADSEVALTPKAFTVLSHLAESGGRLVSKEELLNRAWAGRVVGDAALQVCIGEIRKALGDDRRAPRYIATVSKRGYRFIAEVSYPQETTETSSPSFADSSSPNLVGRDDILLRLEHCLEDVLKSQRRVVFINGEPGIGKTTLAKAFLARAAQQYQALTAFGQCIDHQGTPEAYLPVLDALGRLCRVPDGDRFALFLRQQAPMWLTQMPALLSEAERERLQRQLIGASRERMLREMVEALEKLATDRPLVLLLEDLQWSDHATLDLLTYLGRRSEPARLLVLGTYRPGDVMVGGHPLKLLREALLGHGQLEEIPLAPVTGDDIALYLQNRFSGLADADSQILARTTYRYTNGNPLFMVNVAAHLQERGWILKERDLWSVRDGYSEQSISVPQSLREMLGHQLQRGSAEQLAILETASVAGFEFSTGELTAGLNLDGPTIEETCDRLAQTGQFLRARGLEEWPDGTLVARYEFAHVLYRDVLYDWLAPVRRATIHQRIGTYLETAFGEEAKEHAEQLSTHFEQARQYDKALLYRRYAADTALRRHAHREAAASLGSSLQLLAKLPSSASKDEQELQLQISLGSVLMALKGYAAQEVEIAYARAKALCLHRGESALTVQAVMGLGTYYMFRGELHAALREVELLYRAIGNQKDQTLSMAPQIALGTVRFYLGELTGARDHLEQGIGAYDPEQHRQLAFRHGQDFGVVGQSVIATLVWTLGFPDQARQYSQEALALAERQRHDYSRAIALFWSARVHHLCGENHLANDLAQRATTFSAEKQFAIQSVASAMMNRLVKREAGKSLESLNKLRAGVAEWGAIGTKLGLPYYLTLLATACGEVGRFCEGTQALVQALDLVEETDERWWESEIHRLKGEFLDKQGASPETVETCFKTALSIARSQHAKSLELRATISLCSLWQKQQKTHQASEMLREIYGFFTEGFDTLDLKTAASMLTHIDGNRG